VLPGSVEVITHEEVGLRIVVLEVSVHNLVGGSLSSSLVEEEVAGRSSVHVLHLKGVVLNQGVHKAVITLLHEFGRNSSFVTTLSTCTIEVGQEVLELLELNVLLIVLRVVRLLHESPVIMEMAGESAIGVSVLRDWASDVRLGILVQLSKSPIVVEVRGESGVGVSILWNGPSDIGLGVFLIVKLGKGPVVVQVRRESAVGVCVLRNGASDIRLRVLLVAKLSKSPVIVEMAREGGVRMSVLWNRTSDVRLRVLVELSEGPVVVEVAGESAIRVSILGNRSSDIGLRVLSDVEFVSTDLDKSKECGDCERIFHYTYNNCNKANKMN